MPSSIANMAIVQAARRVPGLKRVPMMKVLALAEVAMLARDHYERLAPSERRRLVQLARKAGGRPSRLSARERDEVRELVAKAEPRLFVGEAAAKLSPVPLPRRLVEGKRA